VESFKDFVLEQVLDGAAIIGLYLRTNAQTYADFAAWPENRPLRAVYSVIAWRARS
jgi:hypothetical protein